jgi:signal transduction histidine kinase
LLLIVNLILFCSLSLFSQHEISDYEQKQIQKIDSLETILKEHLESEKSAEQQSNLNYALIATGIIFIFIIVLEYRSYRSKSMSAKELNVLNEGLVDSNEKLKENETELKELNDTKDRFFSIIAHDLKNPIGNLKNALEVLSKDYQSFSEEDLGEFLSDLDESARSVFELLENLLHWSRSQRGKIELNAANSNINYVVDSNISLLKQMASQKNINLYSKIEEDHFAFFDNNTISTVIRNLISNAIKFTPDGREIFVMAENSESELKISVCDEGVGISEKDSEKLFRVDEKFSTQGTSGEAGTGLGLILCQDFVEKNGGRIWVESEIGKGSQFIFTLPTEGIEEEE